MQYYDLDYIVKEVLDVKHFYLYRRNNRLILEDKLYQLTGEQYELLLAYSDRFSIAGSRQKFTEPKSLEDGWKCTLSARWAERLSSFVEAKQVLLNTVQYIFNSKELRIMHGMYPHRVSSLFASLVDRKQVKRYTEVAKIWKYKPSVYLTRYDLTTLAF